MERHILARIEGGGLPGCIWLVLCWKCQHTSKPFEWISYSEMPCDLCKRPYVPPPGGNLFVKDYKVTITATYPDLESARAKL